MPLPLSPTDLHNLMASNLLRKKFLEFFGRKGHKVIPSASLIPENDATALFTTAGMHPLVPYLLGEPHPLGKRVCSVQKCLRTDDIDEVGDDIHNTFFEMLGNWSLNDYFKKQAIEMSFEFITKELGLFAEKLAISVFEGEKENNIPCDKESVKIWQELGIPRKRIVYLGRKDNWWGPAGQTGPCGPDTEVFYWIGEGLAPENFEPNNKHWVEIWNNVFMEYEKTLDGKFIPLKQKNVDTGLGLERTAAVLQKKENIFETDLFLPIIEKIRAISSKKDTKAERIIADHLRASVFLLSERISPSNLDKGYVLRRLIRRAIRYGKILGITKAFTSDIAKTIIETYKEPYPELKKEQEFVLSELQKEEENFDKTLERGLKEFEKMSKDGIDGKEAFNLYQTYGFPIELTKELAKEQGIIVDEKEFEQELAKHQELSRTASAGRFKSGLADESGQTIKYHTATHLLLASLRKVLGEDVKQMGANITPERIRFDFSFERKMTDDEIKKVEDLVNEKIQKGLDVEMEEMPKEQAFNSGVIAGFKERYPDRVKVYTIFNSKTGEVFSKEICAGPHIKGTAGLGKFKIVKEESSSSGVRRLRAVLE